MKNMFKTLKQSNRMEKKKLSKNKYKKKNKCINDVTFFIYVSEFQ